MLSEAYAFIQEHIIERDVSPGNEERHYRGDIEPIDFVEDQRLGHHEANVVKYVCRWQDKGGVLDLFKAAWFLMRRITLAMRDGEIDGQAKEAGSKSPITGRPESETERGDLRI